MFVQVKLLNGCPGLFTYKVPEDYDKNNLVGSLVQVPFKTKLEFAIIETAQEALDKPTKYIIKTIASKEVLPSDANYMKFISKVAAYYCLQGFDLIKRLRNFLEDKKELEIDETLEEKDFKQKNIALTDEQTKVVELVKDPLIKQEYFPILLQGVTGSGKTEVYKNLIQENFKLNRTTILLLPEVSLAVQFTYLLKQQLPELESSIFGFHSAISAKEKRQLWQNLFEAKPILIIGVHLPILLPIQNLGLIIVDEEHEVGFQEKKHPKINTKEAALLRAELYKMPIILGSATPSISSLHQVRQKKWNFAQLTKRFAGKFPQVKIVNLTEKNKRANFWISKELEEEISKCLERKEQAILFLNRRGFSFFIQCKDCGHIYMCPSCSVSLTVHENGLLKCHYCNFKQAEPNNCSNCKSDQLLKKGLGTQQLVTIIQKIFPLARVERADLDSTVNKKRWKQTIENFNNGDIDILIGTQTITKGYNFPKVTLVGIIWADLNLGLPIYTAAEVSLQQLIQVSGRAGRYLDKSLVIVQTMAKHDIYEFLEETKYSNFYESEINKRAITNYPPCKRLASIELKNDNEQKIEQESDIISNFLRNIINKEKLDITILGPAQPPIYKVKNIQTRQIFLKSQSISILIKLYNLIPRKDFSSSIFFTPNPLI